MVENNMPTAEADVLAFADPSLEEEAELASYELAFHILPTVVEGEVPTIFDALKAAIVSAGGEVTDEEAAQRFDLAYEIVKYLEGKNRSFKSAYFGWIRFSAAPAAVAEIVSATEGRQDILRHLLVRLNREEEQHPFRFHDALASQKQVRTVGDNEEVPVAATEDVDADAVTTEGEGSLEDTEETPAA